MSSCKCKLQWWCNYDLVVPVYVLKLPEGMRKQQLCIYANLTAQVLEMNKTTVSYRLQSKRLIWNHVRSKSTTFIEALYVVRPHETLLLPEVQSAVELML